MTFPRPLPGRLSRAGTQTIQHGSLSASSGNDAKSLGRSEIDRRANHQHSHNRKHDPEPGLGCVGLKPQEHFGEPGSTYCGANLSRRTASPFVVYSRGISCNQHTRPVRASKPKSSARLFVAPHDCAAQTSVRFARLYGRTKPHSSLPLSLAAVCAQRNTKSLASANLAPSPSKSCSTKFLSHPNPAPIRAGCPITDHKPKKGQPIRGGSVRY